jgi:diguanylate cyclase (GGDEF)-like protein/putative nucleotidyltransferase with HDIG domain/PAS domain S-box-containing protein
MKLGTIARINFAILVLCVASVMFASALGWLPDERKIVAKSRGKMCEAMATSITHLVGESDFRQARSQLELLAKRNPELISAGLRRADGKLLASTERHSLEWEAGLSSKNDGCYKVPILNSDASKWGDLEIQYQPVYQGIAAFLNPATILLCLLLTPMIGVACWLHLRRILKYLDPSRVIPPRVRQTLDSFIESVVLMDKNNRIVLANQAFSKQVNQPADDLLGQSIDQFDWQPESSEPLPWSATNGKSVPVGGAMLKRNLEDKTVGVYSVNSSPVMDENGKYQGSMVVFADVTPLERKRQELAQTLEKLLQSKVEITKQNEELRFLAARDPLTACMNRRSFFEYFSEYWDFAKENHKTLCAVMVDVDFFKSINDTYGHGRGDEVLRRAGALLNSLAGKHDIVCRYGGEEFSVVMLDYTLDQATEMAEKIRHEFSELDFGDFKITVSVGVSSNEFEAANPQELLDQADMCLYVAKRNGRNQVVRFDLVPNDVVADKTKVSKAKLLDRDAVTTRIQYPAVAALLSALSYRDPQTGAHSARVSHYAAILAQRVLRPRDVYIVEMAGLLHDIGKVGVPDSILLKPGKLTEEEWEIMEQHDQIGIEIISKAFKCPELTEIVVNHHTRWDGQDQVESLPSGEDIPIGARILTIVDAFDAMVSDRPYRKGRPMAEAVKELQRCAGGQFDPKLVEIFSHVVDSGAIEMVKLSDNLTQDEILNIGEQVESLVTAIDRGDQKLFIALAGRLRQTAEKSNAANLANAVGRVIDMANDTDQHEQIARETMELLSMCRSIHRDMAHTTIAEARNHAVSAT